MYIRKKGIQDYTGAVCIMHIVCYLFADYMACILSHQTPAQPGRGDCFGKRSGGAAYSVECAPHVQGLSPCRSVPGSIPACGHLHVIPISCLTLTIIKAKSQKKERCLERNDINRSSILSWTLHTDNVRCSPHHQNREPAHFRWSALSSYKTWGEMRRHLPSMLIKFCQFSIPCCCLRDFSKIKK